jgi:hypothetical protein
MLFVMDRRPVFYSIAAGAIVVLHGYLCHDAAVCRGYPPLKPHELIAVFLAPIGMLLPALFDDARNDVQSRWFRSAWVAVGFCFIWGIVATNLEDVRPSTGHLMGMMGVVTHLGIIVWFKTLLYLAPATVFFYCVDGVAIGMWSLVRRFREQNDSLSEPSA